MLEFFMLMLDLYLQKSAKLTFFSVLVPQYLDQDTILKILSALFYFLTAPIFYFMFFLALLALFKNFVFVF